MKLSVIIPVFNEAAYITEVIERVLEVPLPAGVEREVIVVDDGSTDGSYDAALAKLSAEVCVLRLPQNAGKGRAIREGLARASGALILIQDADLEYDPSQHPLLLAPILRGEAAVVYGSRFLGSIEGMRLSHRLANYFLSGLASLLFQVKITDEATGLKAFRAEHIQALSLRCRRFEFCPEVTAKLLRRKIVIKEIPIRYVARSTSQGKKIRWWDGVIAAYTLLRYRISD